MSREINFKYFQHVANMWYLHCLSWENVVHTCILVVQNCTIRAKCSPNKFPKQFPGHVTHYMTRNIFHDIFQVMQFSFTGLILDKLDYMKYINLRIFAWPCNELNDCKSFPRTIFPSCNLFGADGAQVSSEKISQMKQTKQRVCTHDWWMGWW